VPTNPVEVFYSYAHEDEALRDKLKKQLASLKRQGLISEWYDRDISPGNEWNAEIENHLNSASVILLLVSPDFISSDYCNDVEVKRAMERHEEGRAKVIPVILRAANWKGSPFSKLKALPADGRPVTSWPNQDEAFLDIATGIERAINELNSNSALSSHLSPLAYIEPESAIGFVARKDRDGNDLIEQLRTELAPRKGRVVALWGAGGVGKTALAARAVRSLIDDYQQRVAWISADGREEFALPNLLDEISNQLGRPELRTLGLEAKKQSVYELVTESPSLIVLDNLETVNPKEQSRCLDWLTHLSPSSVLITTRARIELSAIRNIPIDRMLASEANEFLDRLVQQAQHRHTFEHIDKDRLIATAEANPLILQWIFAQIDLAQDWQEVLDELAQGEGDAAHRVFDRSFKLPLLDNGGRAALLALSLFVPSASRPALAEVAGLSGDKNKKKFREATKSLAALWLIRTIDDGRGGTRLTVEGLTRDLAKARLGTDQRSIAIRKRFVERFATFAEKNSKETPSDFNALENEKENLFAAIDVAFAEEDWATVASIYLDIGSFMYLRGHLDEAISRGEKAKVAAFKDNNKHDFAAIIENLANIRADRGEYGEAEQIYHETLGVFRDLKSDQQSAVTLINLGSFHLRKAELLQAKQLYRESLEIYERLGDESGIGVAMYCLGHVVHIEGDTAEARQFYISSLNKLEKSGSQRDIAWSIFLHGNLEEDQGEMKRARHLYLDALQINRRLGNQGGIGSLLTELGSLERQEGNIEEALKLCSESLEIEKRLGNKKGYLNNLYRLGEIAFDQGDLAETRRLFEQSLEIGRRLGDPLSAGTVLHGLGNLELSEDALGNAEPLLKESVDILRRVGARRYLARPLDSLGRLRTAQSSFPEAREIFREALEIAEALGQKPIIARIKHSTGLLAEKENNLTQASKLYHEALELYETLGFAKAKTVRADLQRLERAEK